MKKNLSIYIMIVVGLLFAGCTVTTDSQPKPIVSQSKAVNFNKKVDPVEKAISLKRKELTFLNSTPIKDFVVVGEGIAPQNTMSPAQAIVLAKRAAVADAYRQLGAKLYGVKVNAKDTVRDAALSNSKITTQVNGLVKDANIVETTFKNGLCKVKMELKIDRKTWKRIFSY